MRLIRNWLTRNFLLFSILFIVLYVFFSSLFLVSSFAVSSPYGVERELKMYRGESKIINLTLQNAGAEEEVVVQGSISSGSDIASFVKEDKKYSVPPNVETEVELKIKIPKDAEIGDKYLVKADFNQILEEGKGMVQLALGGNAGFNVIVVEKPKGEGISITWIVLIILIIAVIIIIVIYFLIKRRKEDLAAITNPH